jgi:hypothetical protein
VAGRTTRRWIGGVFCASDFVLFCENRPQRFDWRPRTTGLPRAASAAFSRAAGASKGRGAGRHGPVMPRVRALPLTGAPGRQPGRAHRVVGAVHIARPHQVAVPQEVAHEEHIGAGLAGVGSDRVAQAAAGAEARSPRW